MYSHERAPIRIAIFEDNKLVRATYEAVLSGTSGLQCTGVYADCADLAYKINRSTPDIVLMDIEMPGMDGIRATETLARTHPEVKILIQTVFAQEDKIFAAICAGASGYVLKTTSPAGLVQAIFELHEGGSPMTPSVATKVLRLFQQTAPQRSSVLHGEALTSREQEILRGMVQGESPRQIGEELFISYETVRSHIKNIYKKLHVVSATAAVAKAIQERIV